MSNNNVIQVAFNFKEESSRVRAGRELADIVDGFASSGRVSKAQARNFRAVMTATQARKDRAQS